MTKMTPNASQIFNFLRGAMRGTWGVEDFRGKRVAIIGMGITGQQLLTMLCFEGVGLFFYADSVVYACRVYVLHCLRLYLMFVFSFLGDGVLT